MNKLSMAPCLGLLLAAGVIPTQSIAEPVQKSAVSANLDAAQVLAISKKVADWQQANPSQRLSGTSWEQGVFYTGVMALYGASADTKYLDAMLAVGEKNGWKPGARVYHADDHTVIQTYLDLFRIKEEASMLAPSRERFDFILANPKTAAFSSTAGNSQNRWSWCDALFMAPAAWARMTTITGDKRYLDFADREWWATTDLLYDPAEHLFYRDNRFIPMKTPGGKKVFWGRGNGWVYAGLARFLSEIPSDYPARPKYVKLFGEMTDAIVKTQSADGLWRPSLLDPDQVPKGESSGSGLFLFGLAWGMNHGLLDRSFYRPILNRGWEALSAQVKNDGQLVSVQQAGDRPANFGENSSNPFGTGAFLLAGSEIYQGLVQQRK